MEENFILNMPYHTQTEVPCQDTVAFLSSWNFKKGITQIKKLKFPCIIKKENWNEDSNHIQILYHSTTLL
jgi:hypothetical protein